MMIVIAAIVASDGDERQAVGIGDNRLKLGNVSPLSVGH
jgi:hypothetical protein